MRGHVIRVQQVAEAPIVDADSIPPWESTEEVVPNSSRALMVDLAVDQMEDLTPDTSTMVPGENGGIRVTAYEAGAVTLSCGDRIEIPVALTPPDRFRDPGVFQYADYLAAQGIFARGHVVAAKMRRLGASKPTIPCRLAAAQRWAAGTPSTISPILMRTACCRRRCG